MADQDRWNEQRGRYSAEDQARRGYRDHPGPSDYGSDDFERGGYAREPRAFDDGEFNTGHSYGDDGYGRYRRPEGGARGGRDHPAQSYRPRSHGAPDDRASGYPTPDYGTQGYGDYGTQGYGGQAYAGQSYGVDSGREGAGRDDDRSWMERAGERIGSWFGIGDGGPHRGRGPKNHTRSDERVRDDINDRLTDDTWTDASEIEVLVKDCEVTLSGTVASREEKRRAEDLAEQVSGVKHVQNNLRVERQSGVAQSGEGQAGEGQVFASTLTSRPLADADKSGPAGNA